MDCIEREVEINDADQMIGAIELLGYHKAVNVVKARTKTMYNGMEICLDEVKDLGSFIEVEKIVDGDGEEVQNELFIFLETLGVKREDRVMNGYDTMVYLKNGSSYPA
jgi:adenylate cyclase class 2